MKIRCYRAKPTRKQVRLYCKFVLYCELLSNLCIRVKIYSQKQLVAENLDYSAIMQDVLHNSVIYIFSICSKIPYSSESLFGFPLPRHVYKRNQSKGVGYTSHSLLEWLFNILLFPLKVGLIAIMSRLLIHDHLVL